MSWPTEYRVMRVKPWEDWPTISEWIRHGDGVFTTGAYNTFYWRGGFASDSARPSLRPVAPLGRWFTISAAAADRLATEPYQDWGRMEPARDYPDGAVDLFSELVCDDANIVEGRYEPDGPWIRLEPGFKSESPDAPRRRRKPGRPARKNDPRSQAIWDRIKELEAAEPELTEMAIAQRVTISEDTLRRYRDTFEVQ